MNGMPTYIGESKLGLVQFIDGLPEVFEEAATWLWREKESLNGQPDISHVTLNENEDGDWILSLYFIE